MRRDSKDSTSKQIDEGSIKVHQKIKAKGSFFAITATSKMPRIIYPMGIREAFVWGAYRGSWA